MAKLQKLLVQNYRSLEKLTLETGNINVLFGPNGSGKSTILDALWFLKDCIIRGVEEASSQRNHGLGLRWDKAEQEAKIHIGIGTKTAHYEVTLGLSSGRLESFAGEMLRDLDAGLILLERKSGSDQAIFYHYNTQERISFPLRDSEQLALARYIDFETKSVAALAVYDLLYYANLYHSRSADLHRLKKLGSESNQHVHLYDRCQNLWSVLRNLDARRSLDDRYETIIHFLRKSFPGFRDLFLEQTGPNSIYGNIVETEHSDPIPASGVSDGHLQMLANLTALFSTGTGRDSLILFDEPETSLHPHAISVFAEAVKVATEKWNKQVFIATHSPVLLSQFDAHDIYAVRIGKRGETELQRVSEIEGVQDLLEDYATGSLYMAGILAPQDNESIIAGV